MTRNSIVINTDNLLEVDWTKYRIEVDTLVVENGQGLLLDKEYAPIDENGRTDIHTTPSNCGIKGVITAFGDFDYKTTINANYITRTYFTRHGNGPFPEYSNSLTFIDKTNKPNDYQDSLRFGYMTDDDVYELWNRVNRDFRLTENTKGNISVVATHCNEIVPHNTLKKYVTYYSYEDDSKKII
jgi:adenylosuccinate synthase